MNPTLLSSIVAIIEAVTKLITALQGIGLNLNNVQISTSSPIDIVALIERFLASGTVPVVTTPTTGPVPVPTPMPGAQPMA